MFEILHEDNHCLVVNKPAGLLAQGDVTGDPSLIDLVKADLKRRYHKPGNVYLGLVHRLDRPVSGAVLLAKTSKAASRLSDQFRRGTILKTYWALVEGQCAEPSGIWEDQLVKDHARNVSRVIGDDEEADAVGDRQGKTARLRFQVLGREKGRTWLELEPLTGRSHQIRVQLAARGLPIVGDRRYGARSSVQADDGGLRIALHSRSIEFTHPTSGEVRRVIAPVPTDWPDAAQRGR